MRWNGRGRLLRSSHSTKSLDQEFGMYGSVRSLARLRGNFSGLWLVFREALARKGDKSAMGDGAASMSSLRRSSIIAAVVAFLIACIGWATTSSNVLATTGAPSYDPSPLANPLPIVAAKNPTATVGGGFSVGADGAASYSIPLQAIPGPGGLTPALSLNYNSRSGNGYFGVGFSLSGVSAITRCPKNLADDKVVEAVKLDKTDPFCLDGKRLIAIKGEYGGNGTEYRTSPQTFAKIVSSRPIGGNADDGPTSFEVRTRDGLIHHYGLEDRDTVGTRNVAWPIEAIIDRHTNVLRFFYKTFKWTTTNPNFPGEYVVVRKLDRIAYGNIGVSTEEGGFDRQIKFGYQSRPETATTYAIGEQKSISERVETIEMQRWDGGKFANARSYRLAYKNDGATGLSKLDSIQQCGLSASMCLPKTTFKWQPGQAGFEGGQRLPMSLPDNELPPLLVLDANGDGVDDLAYLNRRVVDDNDENTPPAAPELSWRVHPSNKNAPFTDATVMETEKATEYPRPAGGFAFDYDLDGRMDIMPIIGYGISEKHAWRPLLSRTSTHASGLRLEHVDTGFNGPMNRGHGTAFFGDFDGDGFQDVVERHEKKTEAGTVTPPYWTIRFRSGTVDASIKPENPADTATDYLAFGHAYTIVDLADASADQVLPIDVDGDGRTEILHRPDPNGMLLALSVYRFGSVWELPSITSAATNLPGWLLNDDVVRIFADTNGDGLIDIVTNAKSPNGIEAQVPKVYIWSGMGLGRWTSPRNGVETNDSTKFNLKYAVVVDYDGDGQHDLLVPTPTGSILSPEGSTKWDMHLLRSNGWDFDVSLSIGMKFNVPTNYSNSTGYVVDPDYFSTSGPQVLDADGDGQDDLILLERVIGGVSGPDFTEGFLFFRHKGQGAPPDLLVEVREGLNQDVAALSIEYQSLTGDSDFYSRGDCDRQIYSCAVSPYYAVTRVTRNAGMLGNAEATSLFSIYSYKNSITHKLTRQWLGFSEQTIISFASDGSQFPVTTRRFFSNTNAYSDPRLDEEWVYGFDLGKAWLERRKQTWDHKNQIVGEGDDKHVLHYDYVSIDETWSYEFSSGPLPVYLSTGTPDEFDANPTVNTDQYRYREVLHNQILEMDNYGNVLRNRSYVGPGAFKTEVKTDYLPPDLDAWLISRPKQIKTSRSLPPDCYEEPACTETRTVEILGYAQTPSGQPSLLPQTVRADADDPSQQTETTYTYDKYGNVIHTSVSGDVDGLGTIGTRNAYVTYDPDGVFPHAVSNDLGQTVRMLHDPLLGVQRVLVDAAGVRSDIQYDSLGRPVKTLAPTGAATSIAYFVEDYAGSALARIESSDTTGAKSERVFDRFGRPVVDRFKGFDGKMRLSTRTFDALGTLRSEDAHPVTVGSAAPPQLRYTYDSRGRRLTQSEPNTANPAAPYLRTWSYEKRTVNYTDTRGNKTVREYGMAGNLGRVTEAAGTQQQITREYRQDAGQRLAKSYVLDRESETANEFGWDRLGRMISRKDPDRGLTTYRYNAFGDLLSSIDANGRETRNRYDVLGRLDRSLTNQVTGNSTKAMAQTDYVYDIELATQDKQPGRLTRMTRLDYVSASANGDEQRTRVDYDYDTFGRLNSELHTLPSETNPAVETQYAIGYSYDQFDRIDEVAYPKLPGHSKPVLAQYRYADGIGGNGQLRAIGIIDNGVVENLWEQGGTDEANRPKFTQTGDGVFKQRTYDWRGALVSQHLQTSSVDICPFCQLAYSAYTYDGEGNLGTRHDLQQGAIERFEYDPLNRVKSSTVDAASAAKQSWDYDSLGNITQNTHRGSYQYEDPSRPMRVTKVSGGGIGTVRTYGYDAVGNQTVRPGENIVYNEMNLPARSQRPNGAVLASFLYGAGGERVRKTSTAGTTTYVRGIYERQRKGPDIEHRLLVPGVAELPYKETNGIAVKQPERYLHGDHLGSTIAVVADDDPGTGLKAKIKETRSYDAFGLTRNPDWKSGSYANVQTALVGQGYTGHNDDPELGLIDMKGRIYDPKLGRMLSADPLVSDPAATQPWNPYAYVRNNPLRYTDPSGFLECEYCKEWIALGDAFFYGGAGGLYSYQMGAVDREAERHNDRYGLKSNDELSNGELEKQAVRQSGSNPKKQSGGVQVAQISPGMSGSASDAGGGICGKTMSCPGQLPEMTADEVTIVGRPPETAAIDTGALWSAVKWLAGHTAPGQAYQEGMERWAAVKEVSAGVSCDGGSGAQKCFDTTPLLAAAARNRIPLGAAAARAARAAAIRVDGAKVFAIAKKMKIGSADAAKIVQQIASGHAFHAQNHQADLTARGITSEQQLADGIAHTMANGQMLKLRGGAAVGFAGRDGQVVIANQYDGQGDLGSSFFKRSFIDALNYIKSK
jgi:RHS repeat-associated protein